MVEGCRLECSVLEGVYLLGGIVLTTSIESRHSSYSDLYRTCQLMSRGRHDVC